MVKMINDKSAASLQSPHLTHSTLSLPKLHTSHPSFLSTLYVEQSALLPASSKYPIGECVNDLQFDTVKTLFDNFYKYYPPSKKMDTAIATRM